MSAAMTETALDLALAQNATLGEGLLWQGGRWWWTDIEAATLYAWTPGAPGPQFCRLPDRLGSFAHCRSGRVLLGLAKRLGLATLGEDLALNQLQTLVPVDAAEPRTRINDGRTDRSGNFVFGTLNEARERRPKSSRRLRSAPRTASACRCRQRTFCHPASPGRWWPTVRACNGRPSAASRSPGC